MASDELVVIDRSYELVRWFLGHLAKFPRSHRYGLGQRIESQLYRILEGLIRAKYSGRTFKGAQLEEVNLDLEVLRMFCRLADERAALRAERGEDPQIAPIAQMKRGGAAGRFG